MSQTTKKFHLPLIECNTDIIGAPSSEFVSSSIPSWHILTVHAQPFRGARDLAFYLKVPLDSLLVWASSGGSGETARMRRLAWTFAARIGDKYQIRLTRSILNVIFNFSVSQPVFPVFQADHIPVRDSSWQVYLTSRRSLQKSHGFHWTGLECVSFYIWMNQTYILLFKLVRNWI